MIYRYKDLYLKITSTDEFITRIEFIPESRVTAPMNPLEEMIKTQLDAYFTGSLRRFDLPFDLKGTEFQNKCWRALADIPYGETITYGQLAERVGSPRAYRAVGNANHNNPLPILLPCHRVIGSGGELRGFAGGLELKQMLLDLEKA